MNPKGYIGAPINLVDLTGIVSIILYLTLEHDTQGDFEIYFLLGGMFLISYKAILSISILSEKFMVSMKLINNSLINLIPFLCVFAT